MGLVFCKPNQDSIDLAVDAAKQSGDISRISETDLALVSLALEKSALLITDDYRMQNIASFLELEWQGVSEAGIREVWSWTLVCSGCKSEYDAPESTYAKQKNYGECHDCGAALRLKRKKCCLLYTSPSPRD